MNVEKFHTRLKELYLPASDQFQIVDVPEIRFAIMDGQGDPAGDQGAEAVKWLYAIAHLVKPKVKERMGKTFAEPPLEWLYGADDEKDFIEGRRAKWKWRAMIVFIDWITPEDFAEAVATAEQKRGPAPDTLRIETLHEGKCVQIMHIGDYPAAQAVCDRLYTEFLPQNNLTPRGCYHEIYLNDPARTAPEKRKMVIRQPVV